MVYLEILKNLIFINVNNPTLNRNIGKFNLPYIWDRVLLNTPGLTLKRHAQAVVHANPNISLLTQPNLPMHLGQSNTPTQFLQVLSMLIEPLRTHIDAAFQFSLRPDEIYSSGCKLVYNYNQSSVPEKNLLIINQLLIFCPSHHLSQTIYTISQSTQVNNWHHILK